MDNVNKKSIVELQKLLSEKELSLREIRFGSANSKSKNVKEYGSIKRDIARVKTEIRNRELGVK